MVSCWYYSILRPDQIITSEYHCVNLQTEHEKLYIKQTASVSRHCVLVLHDNTRPHDKQCKNSPNYDMKLWYILLTCQTESLRTVQLFTWCFWLHSLGSTDILPGRYKCPLAEVYCCWYLYFDWLGKLCLIFHVFFATQWNRRFQLQQPNKC